MTAEYVPESTFTHTVLIPLPASDAVPVTLIEIPEDGPDNVAPFDGEVIVTIGLVVSCDTLLNDIVTLTAYH